MRRISALLILLIIIGVSYAENQGVSETEQNEIHKFILGCLESPETCDCSKTNENGRGFCNAQLEKVNKCMKGIGPTACENMEEVILPDNMPGFMKKFMGTTLKDAVKNKKASAIKKSTEQAKLCVEKPEECDCSNVPGYAKDFCSNKKDLAIQCMKEYNITACMILDADESVLPPTVPEGIRKILEPIIKPIIDAKKNAVKQLAAKDAVVIANSCFANIETCDCSKIPHINGRLFCKERVDLVGVCMKGDIEACMTLDSLPIMPDDVPEFIRNAIEPLIKDMIKQKKMMFFASAGIPSECMDLTIDECKKLVESRQTTVNIEDI